MVAECCTHESGHTVGLSHQAKYDANCNLLATYNIGQGTGETGWAPIMGNSYYENFSGWYNGPTPNGCSADQDALSIITSINGFTYRVDDHSDDPNVNPSMMDLHNDIFADSGIITTSTDKDVFKLTFTQPGQLHLDAKPYSIGANNEGADLDVKLELLNSSSQVIQVYNPIDILNATIDTSLNSGVYFLVIEGAGNQNTSNYGSLGSYTIAGTFSPLFTTPIKEVLLTGKINNDKHVFNWNIISDEPASSLSLESSLNGTSFTTLTSLPQQKQGYSYVPAAANTIYYRLKVISVTGQTMYSNIIALKQSDAQKLFSVSTMIHTDITVNARENYEYQIADMSGRIIAGGHGKTGLNSINISNNPNGIYLIRIISNNQRLTEKIVKL
jgi:hypothetical protein